MSLRIERIETRIVDHPLRADRLVASFAGIHNSSRFVIVTVHDADGFKGHGEAATTALWSGESAETARCMIDRCFAPLLAGNSFDHPCEALARMDELAYGNPFAKSAVDTALWDLWARSQQVSAIQLFGDRQPPLAIPTRASVGAYPVPRTLEIARGFWEAGVRTLKFKTGVPGIDDAQRLRAVRELLGDEPVFTIDYNGAFRDVDTAVASIEALLPFRLALVEQPTHRERIGLLGQVRQRVRVPILADECIFTPDQLAEALDLDAFDILSVYPGKNGGFTRALAMARTAQRAGRKCAIGSNLETDLGQAAMACLAAGLSVFPVEQIACDLPAALFYQRSSVNQPLQFAAGRVTVPTGHGFGVEPVLEKSGP